MLANGRSLPQIAMNQNCSNSNIGRVTSQYQSFVWIEVYQNLIRGQYILQLFKCCLFLIFPLPGCCLLCQAVERLCHAGQIRDELPVELYCVQDIPHWVERIGTYHDDIWVLCRSDE